MIKRLVIIVGLYFLIYLIYFKIFYDQRLLPGHTDVWYNLAILRQYVNFYDHFFHHITLNCANYPEGKIFLYGEPAFLVGPFYYAFLFLFQSDFTAYIALIITFYTLNSVSLAYFISKFCKTKLEIGFIAGLLFSFSAFNLGLLDNLFYAIFFPVFTGLWLLENWLDNNKKLFFVAGIFLISIQLYFSVYNCLMGFIILGFWILIKFKWQRKNVLLFLAVLPMVVAILFPYLYLFVIKSKVPPYYNGIFTLALINDFGFGFQDFFRSLQSNLIYGNGSHPDDLLKYYWHVGNLGLISSLIALVGFFYAPGRQKVFIILLFFAGFFMCCGPYLTKWQLKSPTWVVYTVIPFLKNFKMIFKFYYLVLFAFIIAYVYFVVRFISNFSAVNRFIFYGLLLLTFLTENLPFNRTEFSTRYQIPGLDASAVAQLRQTQGSVLMLPAYTPVLPEPGNNCFVDGRESEYRDYYIQAHYNINMLNGTGSFVLPGRLMVHNILYNHNANDAINILKRDYNLQAIIFDKSSSLKCTPVSLDTLLNILPNRQMHTDYVYFPM
jgi:hypothetical protein